MKMQLPALPKIQRSAVLAIPLVLVNTVAVSGQLGWANEHLPATRFTLAFAVAFASAVESVAVYLAYEAHQARLAGDAAGWLSAAAYAVAGFAAVLNFDHWSGRDESIAWVFAAMSGLSPWLWSIRSRSIHRAQLREKKLIEARAVKFGRARWLLYPVRTYRMFRAAVWAAETDPVAAMRFGDQKRAGRVVSIGLWPPSVRVETSGVQAPDQNVTVDSPVAVTAPAGSGVTPPDARPVGAPTGGTSVDGTQVSRTIPPETPRLMSVPGVTAPVGPAALAPVAWRAGLTEKAEVRWLAIQYTRGCRLKECRETAGWSKSTAARRSTAAKALLLEEDGLVVTDGTESDSEREVARA